MESCSTDLVVLEIETLLARTDDTDVHMEAAEAVVPNLAWGESQVAAETRDTDRLAVTGKFPPTALLTVAASKDKGNVLETELQNIVAETLAREEMRAAVLRRRAESARQTDDMDLDPKETRGVKSPIDLTSTVMLTDAVGGRLKLTELEEADTDEYVII